MVELSEAADDLEAGATGGGAEDPGVDVGGGGAAFAAPPPQATTEQEHPGGEPSASAREPLPELSEADVAAVLKEADALKAEGNALFGAGDFEAAASKYSDALEAAAECAGPGGPAMASARATYLANRGAARLQVGENAGARDDCSASLALAPGRPKVLMRRARACERLEEWDQAHADAEAALACEGWGDDKEAQAMVRRVKPKADAAREKLKEETMEQLKGLGNSVLGMFGLSLDNFSAEKDPSTGSYNIQFQQ